DRSAGAIADARSDGSVSQSDDRDYGAGPRSETRASRYESGVESRYDSRAYGYYGPGYGSALQDRSPRSSRFDPATQYYRPGYGSGLNEDAAAAQYDNQPPPLQMPPAHYMTGR